MSNAESQYDVFISYSHNDSDWVRGYLIPILISWGLNVAIDNQVFVPGQSLDSHIQNTINASKRVVFVCTQHFMASKWCLQEVEKTLKRDTITPIPLVLDGAGHVPPGLMNITWADLTDRQHDENEWRKLCMSLDGAWSTRTDQILAELKDLSSFFGGFMNNKTTTYVVQRSHNVVHGEYAVDHMITVPSVEALAVVYLLLGRIQKIQRVQTILSNDYSELSHGVEDITSGNYIVLGGSRPDIVTHYSGRDFNAFYWDNQLPLSHGQVKAVDWEAENWGYIIYKSKASVDDSVIFLYSPSGVGTQMAAEQLLMNYWEMAREKKGQEFFQAYDYDRNLVYEHIYQD